MDGTPTSVGPYRLERELGRAGGVVRYRARNDAGRGVFLRVAYRSEVGDESFAVYPQLFARHMELARRLSEEYITPDVYGTGHSEDVAYIAFELLVEVQNLKTRSKSGAVNWREAFEIGMSVADMLKVLHREQFVHRNVTPSNILDVQDAVIVFADLSLALDISPGAKADVEIMMGTPLYMSPEQLTGARLDGRSDIFSLGIVLYELITGERPFTLPGAAASVMRSTPKEPKPPSAANPSVPSVCDAIVLKALAKDREKRYASAAELGEAMKAARLAFC